MATVTSAIRGSSAAQLHGTRAEPRHRIPRYLRQRRRPDGKTAPLTQPALADMMLITSRDPAGPPASGRAHRRGCHELSPASSRRRPTMQAKLDADTPPCDARSSTRPRFPPPGRPLGRNMSLRGLDVHEKRFVRNLSHPLRAPFRAAI
ncbi:hypothetical protein Franean1_2585 [Parafrankia sp. EAN1pec]|nr:hypothetical protein Franean1_2585 [Frankia sp. EAN1pec]